jgi:hypothetical protein
MNVIPQDILEKYKTVEDLDNPDRARLFGVEFGKLHMISKQAAFREDPLAGRSFIWQPTGRLAQYPGILEVIGALDAHLSYAIYKPHWIFETKGSYIDCRVELIRAILVLKGIDVSLAEGMLLKDVGRGRPVWTGELLTIELLRILGTMLGKSHALPASIITPRPVEAEAPTLAIGE